MMGIMDPVPTESEIRHDLITNRATSSYAVYHLVQARLARYEREFPKKVLSKSDAIQRKKKVSRDAGFFDDDDDTASIVTTPSRLPSQEGTRKTVSQRNLYTSQSNNCYTDIACFHWCSLTTQPFKTEVSSIV